MKLKQVNFITENCEDICIDGKYVGEFLCDDIHNSIRRVAINSFMEMNVTSNFAIEISKLANAEYKPFGQKRNENDLKTVFERLTKYNDITSIEFELQDDCTGETKKYNYFVDWCGDDEYTNAAQFSYVSNLGNLYILITPKVEKEANLLFKEYFNLFDIEDEGSINLKFSAYGIDVDEDSCVQNKVAEKENNKSNDDIILSRSVNVEERKAEIQMAKNTDELYDILEKYNMPSISAKIAYLCGLFGIDIEYEKLTHSDFVTFEKIGNEILK